MKNLKLKETGEVVRMGDTLIKELEVFGIPGIVELTIDETTLPELIKHGVIEEEFNITIKGAVQHLADRIGWGVDNLEKYFNNLHKISPTAVFEIILKEVAILLDQQYPDHISNSKEIWVINKTNGEISKLHDLNKVKSFQHFAAFRSLEDALVAKKVMAPALKDLYGK